MAAGITVFIFLVFMVAIMGALSRMAPKHETGTFVSQRKMGSKLIEDRHHYLNDEEMILIDRFHPESPYDPSGINFLHKNGHISKLGESDWADTRRF